MGLKLFGKNILQVYTHKIMKIEYKTAAGNPEKSSYTLRKINNDIITEELTPIGTTVTVSNLKHLLRVNGSRCEGFIFGADDTPIGTIWLCIGEQMIWNTVSAISMPIYLMFM